MTAAKRKPRESLRTLPTNAKGDRTGRGAHRASAAPRTEPVPDGGAAHLKAPYERTAKKRAASRKSPPAPAEPAKPYEPTPRERAAVEKFKARRAASKPAPRLKMAASPNGLSMDLDHPDSKIGSSLLHEALGIADHDVLTGLLDQLVNFSNIGKQPNEAAINSALAMVKGIEPRDTLEAMLATQMAAVHFATMTFARRLNHVDNIPQQDSASNAFNKLARTFAAQLEALNRHRGKGQQKMTVEHVHVHAGGQAIVAGNVQGGGASTIPEGQAHAPALGYEPGTPMPSQDAQRQAVPSTES